MRTTLALNGLMLTYVAPFYIGSSLIYHSVNVLSIIKTITPISKVLKLTSVLGNRNC